MYAYVINLARSTERRAHITAELERIGIDYEFVDGVEGRDLHLNDPKIIDPSVLGTAWFRPGVAGCAFSHLRVYKKMLDDGREHAIVLEDDVRLPTDLIRVANAIAPHLTGAEVALLNYDSHDVIRMSKTGHVLVKSGGKLLLPLDVNQPRSSAAYVVTQAACKRMVDSIVPFKERPDNWGYFYTEGALDRVRCMLPMAVAKDPRFESTIDYSAQQGLKTRIRDMVSRYDIKILQKAIVYRRERIWRSQIRVEVVDLPFVSKPSRL